ncbi:hypothetical protein PMAYCL1PPCAC_09647 [Pristionchus mayeri]|uniref:Uncharacterized protein n=1 Tax=Pristionchus mayeri TaxID=1317129 RepID=A0AAN5CDF9_9BILA|nr:hypothetical protein PMAYCL1PPCAC_09647 [Pristionchus mayeri]
MAPRVDEREKDVILSLILKRKGILIEHRGSRHADLNSEREAKWKEVLDEASRILKRKDLTLIRIRTILRNSLNTVKTLGQITRRYETRTGGGRDEEVEDAIQKMHSQMCPSESTLFEVYRESPAVSGLDGSGDSMILSEMIAPNRAKVHRPALDKVVDITSNDDSIDPIGNDEGSPEGSRALFKGKKETGAKISSMGDHELLKELYDLSDERNRIDDGMEVSDEETTENDHEGVLEQRVEMNISKKRRVSIKESDTPEHSKWDTYEPPKASKYHSGKSAASEKQIRLSWMECLEAQKELMKS